MMVKYVMVREVIGREGGDGEVIGKGMVMEKEA